MRALVSSGRSVLVSSWPRKRERPLSPLPPIFSTGALPPSAGLFEGILSLLQFGTAALQKWARVDREFNLKATYYEELVRLDLVKSENFWSAEYQAHPNGATALESVVIVCDEPAEQHIVYAAFTGRREMRATSLGITIETPPIRYT